MFRTTPHGSKYQINEIRLNEGNHVGSDITYEDLLMVMGPKQKHWEEIFQTGAEFYSPMSRTLSSMATPFYDFVMANGGVQDINRNSARWRTYGTPMTETSSVYNPMTGVDLPGAGNTTGTIVLDNQHYKPQDILFPVNNPNAQILLQTYGEPVTGGWQYVWKTVEDNTYIPPQYFAAGKAWKRSGSVTSWLNSMTYGSTDFDIQYTYLEFQVDLTTFGKEYSVDEETHLQEGSIAISRCDIDDDVWMHTLTNKLELEFEMSYRREKELLMMTGRSSRHHRDVNSKQMITTAPGFFEFLEEANVIRYNPKVNNLDMLSDLMHNFWFDRVPLAQRNLVLMTGEAGLRLFHEWIREKFQKDAVRVPLDFQLKAIDTDPATGKTRYEYGNHIFWRYNLDYFGSITVGHWKMLDDTRVFNVPMPGSTYPPSSFEFIAMDMGLGSPNIKILTRNSKKRRTVINGYWSPTGHVGPDNPIYKTVGDVNLGDAYKVQYRESFGLAVDNVANILRLVPEVR